MNAITLSDHISDQVIDPSRRLVGSRAGTPKRNVQIYPRRELELAVWVLGHHGLAGGQALVGVVGHGEVGLGTAQLVGGVVLVVMSRTRAIDRYKNLGVGGNGSEVGYVVGLSDEGGFGAQEQADGGRRIVRGNGSKGEIGLARGFNVVARIAIRVADFVFAIELFVGHVCLIGRLGR
ncbi:hypothetical protein F2P56_025114 [Juglans regia]|uniref:Uncharacterized protein n=1 Tax=Juglans regia TaxID=51240 RepID=A0A833U1Q4_JUGRE|nr:hypothetical protein F2P56_025114 [Juglans regia]